jgi:MOSC domain-containing protein YiiM
MSLPDGRPHPDVQVAIINSQTADLVAREKSRWALAGDNLYVDLDITQNNLQPGDQLAIGSALLEITEVIHSGCKKFAERYGPDSVKWVNSEQGKHLRLRGIYAKIVEDGVVSVGDEIRKL